MAFKKTKIQVMNKLKFLYFILISTFLFSCSNKSMDFSFWEIYSKNEREYYMSVAFKKRKKFNILVLYEDKMGSRGLEQTKFKYVAEHIRKTF